MALTDHPSTLAYHSSRVLTQHRSLADMPVAQGVARVTGFMAQDQNGNTVPEAEAFWFYGMNHGMALISSRYDPHEKMKPEDAGFVKEYYARMTPAAVRAFYYLLLICTRESRHNKSLHEDGGQIKKLFGEVTANFHLSIKGGEHNIHQALLNSPPKTTLGNYVNSLQWVFYNSKWSGGYGGPAWGKVTDCLCRFVHGEFSAEMMLDTIWTLCHNNGPIFNKGMLYGHYSSCLTRLLDVQRSGQVPEAALYDALLGKFVPAQLKLKMDWLRTEYPNAVGNYVDWFKVEALGAVNAYPSDKDAQVKLHGLSDFASATQKEQAAKLLAKKAAEDALKEYYESPTYEIWPGFALDKIVPKRAA